MELDLSVMPSEGFGIIVFCVVILGRSVMVDRTVVENANGSVCSEATAPILSPVLPNLSGIDWRSIKLGISSGVADVPDAIIGITTKMVNPNPVCCFCRTLQTHVQTHRLAVPSLLLRLKSSGNRHDKENEDFVNDSFPEGNVQHCQELIFVSNASSARHN